LLRVKERAMSERSDSGGDSEMLLLLAIYFHTQQPLSKITSLVADTLNINLKLSLPLFSLIAFCALISELCAAIISRTFR